MIKIDEIRKRIEQKTITLGTETTLKNLRLGKLEKVFVTKNCSVDVRDEIKHVAENIEIVEIDMLNTELGVFCKKPFSISVVGFLRGTGK
jgi:ribosomal protein L30E